MPEFQFVAINSSGETVKESVAAENTSQAQYFLEVRGYYNIRFLDTDLTQQTSRLFDQHQLAMSSNITAKAKAKHMRDTRLSRKLINAAIVSVAASGIFTYISYLNGYGVPYIWLIGFLVFDVYMLMPVVLFDRLFNAYSWNRWSALRTWLKLARLFNVISINRIPAFEMDVYEASMEASEKNLETGIQTIARWRNHKKVTPQIFELGLYRIYNNARDFDSAAKLIDAMCRKAGASVELYVDYAVCLAWRHKRTRDARLVLEQAEKMPQSMMSELALPWARGVIEFEDGNYPMAEFFLRQAIEQQKEFKHNTMMEGLRFVVSGFLGLALARQGRIDEAESYFAPARPFLKSVGEVGLIEDFDALAR